jgi:cobyrinic acid a,c-diamide synthase
VLANRSASDGQLLRNSLPAGMGWFGALPKSDSSLPERHLGLLQAAEITDLAARLDALADALAASAASTCQNPSISQLSRHQSLRRHLPASASPSPAMPLTASSPANLETLAALGAELRFFSPVAGDSLPECDAVWLPGGYPELHADTLSHHTGFWQA